jgi:hypothetical protein
MQRIRMSLPFYREMGWEPVVLCVDEQYVSGFRDELLNETIPEDIEVHKVKAFPEKFSRAFGVGNLSLRSYYQFKKKGTELLKKGNFDLVFFSTSQFHVCALGRHWQKKFGVSFIVDMQDPWRNDFFLSQKKKDRPRKFRVSHFFNKWMENYTMRHAGGIISVSQSYIDTLKERYPELKSRPALLLPFGIAETDFDMVHKKQVSPEIIDTGNGKINVVYVGVLNKFFIPLIHAFFLAFTDSIKHRDAYHFYFIGTNYAEGSIHRPVEELAKQLGIGDLVTEVPERIPYFSALSTLLHANILFIPGSTDAGYNASKIYNNIFTNKPIFSIFNEKSLVKKAIDDAGAGIAVGVNEQDTIEQMTEKIKAVMPEFEQLHLRNSLTKTEALQDYVARAMVIKQVSFFNKMLPLLSSAATAVKSLVAVLFFL